MRPTLELTHRELFYFIFSVSIRNPNTFIEINEMSGVPGVMGTTFLDVHFFLNAYRREDILEFTQNAFASCNFRPDFFISLNSMIVDAINTNSIYLKSITTDIKIHVLAVTNDLDTPCSLAHLDLYFHIFSAVWDAYCVHNYFNPEQAKFIQHGDIFCKLHYLELGNAAIKITSVDEATNLANLNMLGVADTGPVSLFFETSCGKLFKFGGEYNCHADLYIRIMLDCGFGAQNKKFYFPPKMRIRKFIFY